MSRVRPSTITVEMTPDEKAMLTLLCERAGVYNAANLVRVALWSFADELGLDVTPEVFATRTWGGTRKGWRKGDGTGGAVSRREPAATAVKAAKAARYVPARDHQWRRPLPELMHGARTRRIIDSIAGKVND